MKLKGLNAFFGNSKVLLFSFVLFFATIILGLFSINHNENPLLSTILTVESLVTFLLVLALFISYVLHESNIQKSLISNIYLLQILKIVVGLISLVRNFNNYNAIYHYMAIIEIILWILSYIIHLVLLSDKTGKNINIRINQIMFFIIFIAQCIFLYDKINVMHNTLPAIANVLLPLFMMVCIDTKIGNYKKTRLELKEKGKWDDKAKAEAKKIFNLF